MTALDPARIAKPGAVCAGATIYVGLNGAPVLLDQCYTCARRRSGFPNRKLCYMPAGSPGCVNYVKESQP